MVYSDWRRMIYFIIIILIFVAEIFTKDYIERHQEYCKEKKVLKGKVSITKQYNKGACMNLLEKKEKLVRYLSSSMLVALVVYFLWKLPKKGEHSLKLGLSFVIGGALSNICDRLFKGHVVDYLIINVKKLKNVVFNIGDLFIFLGSFILAIYSLFHKK